MNIKTALFFLAFLPQFVSPAGSLVAQLAILGTICVLMNTVVDIVAVYAAARILESARARATRARWFARASGATMVALGASLAFVRRQP